MAARAQVNPFFSPTQISGLRYWYDAADVRTIQSSGNNLISVQNKGSLTQFPLNSNVNTAITGATTVNGFNVIRLASGSRLVFQGDYTLGNLRTHMVVSRPLVNTTTTNVGFFWQNVGFNADDYFALESNKIIEVSQGLVVVVESSAIGTNLFNQPTLFAVRCVSAASNIGSINGSNLSLLSSAIPAYTNPVGGSSFFVNANTNSAQDLCEILSWNRSITNEEFQQAEGYLAWKWGLQANLPSNHPYKSSIIPPLLSPQPTLPLLTESWNPRQIPGLCIWFDCADSSTLNISNNIVSTWRSKGSEPLVATSVGGGSILYSNFNNLPALYFNGTNTRMTTNTISSYGTTGTTWLTVSVNLTPVTNSTPVDASVTFATLSGTSPEKSIRYNFVPQFVIYTFNNGQIRGGRTNNDNGVRGFIDGPTSMNAYANGTDFTESILSATFQPGVNQAFQLGQWNTGWLLGFIQEVIVYNSALNLAQYQLVEGYLAWKWGFQRSLTANHPYRNTPPISASIQYPLRSVLTTASWLPTRISGCQLWLDGADPNGNNVIPAVGTSISTWVDKSGAGANGTVVGTAAQYASGRGLLFAASGAYNTPYSASLTNESLFIVFRYTRANAQQGLVAQTGDGGRAITILAGSSTAAFESSVYNVAFGAVSPSTTVPQSAIGIGVLVTRNSTMAIFYNGTSFGTPTTVSITAGRTSVIGGAYNGGVPNSAQYFGGTLFEIVGYNVALSSAQQQQVEGYLAWKWGLQANLPASHPFSRWAPPP